MFPRASLVLADGSVHRGFAFGSAADGMGEVVFNTSMTGYQEVLTDPSYAGQLVTLTYPLVGNYGISEEDHESRAIQVAGLIVREHCDSPSHGSSTRTLHEFLASREIPGISGIDTRAVTRRLRTRGVLQGAITTGSPEAALERITAAPAYDDYDYVETVSTDTRYEWRPNAQNGSESGRRILVTDCGLKYNILRHLRQRGCQVTVAPAATPAQELLAMDPSGVLLSPGPGDPRMLDYVVGQRPPVAGQGPRNGYLSGSSDNRQGFGR